MFLFIYCLKHGFGFILKIENRYFFISPYHVYFSKYLERGICSVEINYKTNGELTLQNIRGELTNNFDLMVAEIFSKPQVSFDYFLDSKFQLHNISQESSNIIVTEFEFVRTSCEIKFAERTKKLYNVLKSPKISTKGDSGKLVVTKQNKLVGMLIADSSSHSYVLYFKHILVFLRKYF